MWTAKPLNAGVETELRRLLEQETSWSLQMRQHIAQAWMHCMAGLREARAVQPVNALAEELCLRLGLWRLQQLRKALCQHVQELSQTHAVQTVLQALHVPALQWESVCEDALHMDRNAMEPAWLYQQFMQLMLATGKCKEYLNCLLMCCTASMLWHEPQCSAPMPSKWALAG